ncbi:MAG: hypothetical protein IJI22_00390 [Bacilli bacterium]|nr:hypothetical protein [Bacilli bacterium]
MELFEEIYKTKEEFPKFNSVSKEVKKYKLNFYQNFAIILFIICFFLGIIFGNLFAICETSSYFYSDSCLVPQFNFSLMIAIWFVSLLLSLFIFAIGHIIVLLGQISEKLNKFNV